MKHQFRSTKSIIALHPGTQIQVSPCHLQPSWRGSLPRKDAAATQRKLRNYSLLDSVCGVSLGALDGSWETPEERGRWKGREDPSSERLARGARGQ